MTKEEAKDILFKYNIGRKDIERPDKVQKQITTAIDLAIQALSSLPAPTQDDGWVKVEDGLPDNGYYIVWCKSPDEYGLIHYHNNTGWGNGFYNDRVTHYQIPQPPKTAQQ